MIDLLHEHGGELEASTVARTDWPKGDPRGHRIFEQLIYFRNHMGLGFSQSELDRGTYIECFRLILERADVNVPSKFGATVLHEVAAYRK